MKNNSKVLCLFLSLFLALSLSSCTNSNKKTSDNVKNNTKIQNPTSTKKTEVTKPETSIFPLKIKDFNGEEVTFNQEPTKIVSLAPSVTETLFALEKQANLSGRTDFCIYPEATSKIKSIGSIQEPNVEKIVSLKPDLVFVTTLTKTDIVDKLKSLNIKTFSIDNKVDFDTAFCNITNISKMLNCEDKGNDLIKDMQAKIDVIRTKMDGVKRPKVYYILSYGKNGDFTATGDTFISEMIETAGGENIAKDGSDWKYDLEKLIKKDPDVLICSKFFNSKKGIEQTNGYKDLKAIKEGQLYEIDNNILDIPGPRLAEGLEELARIIHPELYK